ncbi:methylated-DNA--[protein]-cysteine S-methyltransferase [Paraburkholderia sp. A1RI_3L]|uniref:methylated-DNA--[protein]-cysteine S-methyltransferase n=1 Tax=Paraburkholderia TaxID=1822464 RepID=UPI002407D1A1|nr:methylated-DNA--[protein]-cysteine S-methyltransferase [Paraburkholderia sp. SUR17]WEY41912.1 methylated-DNA--[protein]-cysteine S-methyltransferase [Paraburkholderia sp. SUR17]
MTLDSEAHWLTMPSPLGNVLLRAAHDALTGVFFVGQKYAPSDPAMGSADSPAPTLRVLLQARDEIGEYFAGTRRRFTVPLRAHGTAFQRSVWDELVKIPYGQMESYGRIADRLGLGLGAARAVGAANGRNPIAIIVPCHRVIGGNGELTGYAGGIERKEALLALEGNEQPAARQMNLFGGT